MQGNEYFKPPFHEDCVILWLEARDKAIKSAQELNGCGATKQLANRLLEDRHLSCFEHTSHVMTDEEYKTFVKGEVPSFDPKGLTAIPLEAQGYCANFRGFTPYRYMIENEEEL